MNRFKVIRPPETMRLEDVPIGEQFLFGSELCLKINQERGSIVHAPCTHYLRLASGEQAYIVSGYRVTIPMKAEIVPFT